MLVYNKHLLIIFVNNQLDE